MDAFSRIRHFWFGLLVVALGSFSLTWGFWRPARAAIRLDFSAADMTPDFLLVAGAQAGAGGSAAKGSAAESRRMTLDYPTWMRSGDPASVRLTLEILPEQGIQVNPVEMNARQNVFVEASLEMPGLQVDPAFPVGQVLPAGRAVNFWWTLDAERTGAYDGTGWLKLRYQSETLAESEIKVLAAPRLQLAVRRLGPLGGPAARVLGGLLVLCGISWLFWRLKHA